jgi:cell division protein FtsW (lipid II flippase)
VLLVRRNAPEACRTHMYTLIGICLLVAVAVLSGKEQRKGAWLLVAVVIVLVIIADRLGWTSRVN